MRPDQYIGQTGTVTDQIWAAVQRIEKQLGVLVSEDSTIAAEAAAEETSIGQIGAALTSIQSLLAALQAEAAPLSAATLAAAAQVQTDLADLASTAQADVTADQPPAASSTSTSTPAS